MVENGVLSGRDTLPPDASMGITGAVLAVARAAEQQNDLRLISDWYAYLAIYFAQQERDLDALMTNHALAEFIGLLKRLDAGDKQRSAQPLIALKSSVIALVEDVPGYIDQIREVRQMQSDPNL